MSSYPLVLIPKILALRLRSGPADFRQSLITIQRRSDAYRQGHGESLKENTFVRKPPKWMRWLGLGLVVLGLINLRTLLGGVFFASGVLLLIGSWLGKKKTVKKVQREPIPLISQPSELEQRKANLRELASLMEGRVLLPTGTSDAPVGASEKRFGEVLNRYFSGRVFPQMEVPIPNYQHNYSTDFCLSIPEVNLWIDIEIDEPYDYKSGKPTHCCDDGRDANRNTFFLNNGWVVIRFSEQQVVDYPESCCKEIASVIKKLTGIASFSNRLENVLQLTPSPLWTKRQAKEMAKAKVRDKYLNRLNLRLRSGSKPKLI
ncbi:hypothetical protein [Coleofasciculus sp.]|uniref:hypothetical protein n=1 Tax=Coleofasciculus sp. TaxID=3100458 RepID=UPI003A2C380D